MIHECTGSFNNSPPDLFVNNAFIFIQGVKMHSVYLFVYLLHNGRNNDFDVLKYQSLG